LKEGVVEEGEEKEGGVCLSVVAAILNKKPLETQIRGIFRVL